METQNPNQGLSSEFKPGSSVIYAMHGKCNILGTEVRSLSGQDILFYKLEIKKLSLSRSNRQEPAIWVPVASAKDKGLRAPMNRPEAESALAILMSREYYFNPSEPWSSLQAKLEDSIRIEGGVGLAKAASFLYVLKRKLIVAPTEVLKLQETIHKLLFRELSEALDLPIRAIEEKTAKGFRSKLIPDN